MEVEDEQACKVGTSGWWVCGGLPHREWVLYLWQLSTQHASAQASSGMYAAGDVFLFIGVFGALALIPTGLAGYFLLRKFLSR